jgi:hypothetical protein
MKNSYIVIVSLQPLTTEHYWGLFLASPHQLIIKEKYFREITSQRELKGITYGTT